LEIDHKAIKKTRQTKYNLENGKEYARPTKTPYQNMMLDKRVLRIDVFYFFEV
jgi:hypothetical protein